MKSDGFSHVVRPDARRLADRRWVGYASVVPLVVIATLLRFSLQPIAGTSIPFLTYFLASVLVAWRFGFGPAVLCVFVSAALGGHYFLNGGLTLFTASGLPARVAIAGFIVSALLASYLLAALQKALARAKTAEEDQRRANAELVQTNRNLEAFAFAASHDLREPLRTVSTYSQLLVEAARNHRQTDADMAERYIIEGTQRMGRLLDDLLTYTRLHLEEPGESPDSVDLKVVVQHTIQNLQTVISQSHAVVNYANLPVVRGHQVHFVQLFQNLIENAIKYSGERTPEIRITAERVKDEWLVAVRDNGIGIDSKYRDHIFEVFKRLHGSALPGTGVGLAICRRVVEGCGGRIWVESEIGSGSTFYFTLPVLQQTTSVMIGTYVGTDQNT